MATVAGIDEAGRGPVIGPLVICGVLINKGDEEKLSQMGVKDSKLLTPLQREAPFDKILSMVKKYHLIVVSAPEIDKAVEGNDGLNLNWLEANKTAEILNHLQPDEAIIDCPSNNIEKYTIYIKNKVKDKDIKVKAEHKADLNYVVVGAASILAKVTRDREIEKIKKRLKENVGSGYPSDPVTVEFLQKNYKKHPDIFRHSWESYKRLAEVKKQKKLAEF